MKSSIVSFVFLQLTFSASYVVNAQLLVEQNGVSLSYTEKYVNTIICGVKSFDEYEVTAFLKNNSGSSISIGYSNVNHIFFAGSQITAPCTEPFPAQAVFNPKNNWSNNSVDSGSYRVWVPKGGKLPTPYFSLPRFVVLNDSESQRSINSQTNSAQNGNFWNKYPTKGKSQQTASNQPAQQRSKANQQQYSISNNNNSIQSTRKDCGDYYYFAISGARYLNRNNRSWADALYHITSSDIFKTSIPFNEYNYFSLPNIESQSPFLSQKVIKDLTYQSKIGDYEIDGTHSVSTLGIYRFSSKEDAEAARSIYLDKYKWANKENIPPQRTYDNVFLKNDNSVFVFDEDVICLEN